MLHPFKQKNSKNEYRRTFNISTLSLRRYFDKLNMTARVGQSEPVEDCALVLNYRFQPKLNKPFFVLLFLVLQSVSVYSQEKSPSATGKSSTIKTIDGGQYYMHTVDKNQTLYAIAKLYDCAITEIVLENPSAIDGVQPGTVLKIPVKKINKNTADAKAPAKDTSSYIVHKVERGQTLYYIAKMYNTSVDKINELNPQLKNGLKADQTIKIPKQVAAVTKVAPAPTPKPAPATTVVPIPIPKPTATVNTTVTDKKIPTSTIDTTKKKEAVVRKPTTTTAKTTTPTLPAATSTLNATYGYPGEKKEEYNIAFFLPFHADEANEIGIEKLIRGDDQFSNKTNIALQFYEGALLAIDSLKKTNLNAKIFVYDLDDNDSSSDMPAAILKKPELAEMDLIIGPLYASSFMPVAKFSKEHKIPIVSPFVQVNKILFDNPFVCKVTSSNTLQVMQIANFVVDTFHTQNVILVNSGNKKEIELCAAFKKVAKEAAKNKMYPPRDSVLEAKGLEQIKKYLHPTKVNVIVLPSNNQSYVTEFINMINSIQENRKIVLFGLQSWMTFDNLDLEYLNSLSLHIVSNNYIDYSNPVTKNFISKFHVQYKSNPETFAFSGYDLTYYFISSLQKYGKGFLNDIVDNKYKGIVTNLDFIKSTTNKSGFENKFVYMLKYQNYELKPAN